MSEPPPARRRAQTAPVDPAAARSEMYQVAYEESKRTLDDQRSELDGMRDRAVQFIVFVGAATAFLVGTGLSSKTRTGAFYPLAITATAAFAVTLVLLCLVLWPKKDNDKRWHYRVSASDMISIWIESEVPPPTSGEFVRALANLNDDSRGKNETRLKEVRRNYRNLIVVGIIQLGLWIVLVWAKV